MAELWARQQEYEAASAVTQDNPLPVSVITYNWHPFLISDTAIDDSDKTFTVPADAEYQLLSVLVGLITSADVGNRQLSMLITTDTNVVISEMRAGAVQAASGTRRYVVAVGNPDLT
ncbi:MAG: hypothetical protein WC718_18410, partial [Phycisphaerales bacterium]